ncbi:MAG: amidohydrolase family protein, partial [Pseudohongiellaceae bacterium]
AGQNGGARSGMHGQQLCTRTLGCIRCHPSGPPIELLQEAGFHPLEVIQAATLNGAELIGMEEQIGSLVPGKKADIVLVSENPVRNFKVLYGTGHMYLDRESGELKRVGGVSYTIKDGIVFDAKQLLDDVEAMVLQARDL